MYNFYNKGVKIQFPQRCISHRNKFTFEMCDLMKNNHEASAEGKKDNYSRKNL